jgi:hypothetical protein
MNCKRALIIDIPIPRGKKLDETRKKRKTSKLFYKNIKNFVLNEVKVSPMIVIISANRTGPRSLRIGIMNLNSEKKLNSNSIYIYSKNF